MRFISMGVNINMQESFKSARTALKNLKSPFPVSKQIEFASYDSGKSVTYAIFECSNFRRRKEYNIKTRYSRYVTEYDVKLLSYDFSCDKEVYLDEDTYLNRQKPWFND